MAPVSPPVHLCGRRLDHARHVCAFVRSRDEEYGIIAPFVKEGLAQGERVLQIVNPRLTSDHAARMRAQGVDVQATAGQLDVVTWGDAYLKDGYFDVQRMLDTLQAVVKDRRERGFANLRAMGNMEWALQGAPGSESLLEYETRVNVVTQGAPETFICIYEVDKFPASTIIDVMRTHPAVIIDGAYHENPFFVPPQEMLRELQARGKAKGA